MNSKPAAIVNILNGINRYNPENAPHLEAYVQDQCEKQFYDLEANLATLKLYQFVPKEYKMDVVCAILVKALMRLPHSDFSLCKCLLEFRRCDDFPINEILKWHELLEKCEIREFWKRLAEPDNEAILARLNIGDFDSAMRRFVCYVVSNTFQRVKTTMLRDWLGGVSDAEFSTLLTANGWRMEDGGQYVFVANQDELVKSRDVKEHVTIDAIAPVVSPHCH